MGWNGDDQGGSDPLPVDSLVRDIRHILDDFQGICQDYRGQERHCCDSVKSCYNNLNPTLTSVWLQGAIRQNIHQACRRIDEELRMTNSCVDTKLRMCTKIDTRTLRTEFEEYKQQFKTEFDKHCTDLPPERTTIETEPPPPQTSTTTPFISTTKKPQTTSEPLTSTTSIKIKVYTSSVRVTTEEAIINTENSQTATPTTRPPYISRNAVETTASTSIIIVTDTETDVETSTDSKLLDSTVVSEAIKTTPPTNTEPRPAPSQSTDVTVTSTSINSSTVSVSGGTDVSLQHPPSDNTVIIVSAVCCGIILLLALLVFIFIKIRKKRLMSDSQDCQCKKGFSCKWFQRNKTRSDAQDSEIYAEIDEAFMQAVYEFDKKKDPHPNLKNRVQTNAHANVCYSAGMNDDTIISSKKSHGPTLQLSTKDLRQISKQNEYQTAKDVKETSDKNKQKELVLSHPTFTDPRGTDVLSDEYVQISEKYESIEPVYDQPVHKDLKVTEKDDIIPHEYDHILAKETEAGENEEPDYVNSPVSQNNEHLYENELSSYEIMQSRF